jgi:hypothetical protein
MIMGRERTMPRARGSHEPGRPRLAADVGDGCADLGIGNGAALAEREVGKMGRAWRVAS